MNSRYKKILIQVVLIVLVAVFIGCIPELTDETPLAMVNNEPVTFGELKQELQGFHLRTKEKGEKASIDLNHFLNKLIRKQLFIQEALRVGLDKDPEIDLAVDSELKKQAILLLHREEIDNKVSVSDDEAWGEYCTVLNKRRDDVEKMREGFSMDPNARSSDVSNYISGLRKRAEIVVDPNFVWHRDEPCDPNKIVARVNDEGITYHDLSETIKGLRDQFGEEDAWKYAIQGLIDQGLLEKELKMFVPDKESFERSKGRVKKNMKKEQLKEREDAYVEELRQKARISKADIDPNDVLEKNEDPNLPVAWVNDETITFAELTKNIKAEDLKDDPPEERKNIIDANLGYLVDCRLVEQEALSRGYEKRPNVQKKLATVREIAIFNKFFRELLIPSIKLTDEEVESYYQEHLDLFYTPIYVKLDEIRVKTEEEADQIWSELEVGASFTFLSKRSLPDRITSRHWIPIDQFSSSIKEGLMKAKEGERFGPALRDESYSIFLIKRRRGGDLIPFDRAKKDAYDKLWKERFDQTVEDWEKILRESSEIVIYEQRLQAILSGIKGDKAEAVK
ncbi:MAG: peptidyl-prolyl cis-trans isomerase [bacterium]